MKQLWAFILLLSAASLTLACGSSTSNSRQLQSITINDSIIGDQVSFVATGTFSAPPTTVTPLPVSWSLAPPPGNYTLTTQPFTPQCPDPSPIVASAPVNPNAPSSGSTSTTTMIMQSTGSPCPE
jgi:hypothetical protein